jgi:hypothetical protein
VLPLMAHADDRRHGMAAIPGAAACRMPRPQQALAAKGRRKAAKARGIMLGVAQ